MRARVLAFGLAAACNGDDAVPPPADTDPGPADTAPPAPPPAPLPAPLDTAQACYPGPTVNGSVCLETRDIPGSPFDYRYPAPFGGSAQYRAPVRFLDLTAHSPRVELARNFVLGEFASTDRGRWAVVQAPAVAHLQAVRDEVGVLVVNSGYRSPGYNASIPGSATSSRHLYGDGFDLDPRETTLQDVADACRQEDAGFVEVYESHVHCDWRDDALDLAFYDGTRSAVWGVEAVRDATIVVRDGALRAPAEGFDEGEPLREWTAWDADGVVLSTATGRAFVPPDGTVEVEVLVGRVITETWTP